MAGQPAPGTNIFITFDCFDMTVAEPGLPATTIIQLNQAWQATISFRFAELFAPWLVSLPVTWVYTLRAESLGPGPEVAFPSLSGATNPGQLAYGLGNPAPVPTINVPAGALPVGVYKLVGTVTFAGAPPPPMAGYHEGPIIQIIA